MFARRDAVWKPRPATVAPAEQITFWFPNEEDLQAGVFRFKNSAVPTTRLRHCPPGRAAVAVVICASAGNPCAGGVCTRWRATRGISAVIVMPLTTPEIKVQGAVAEPGRRDHFARR